MLRNAVDWFNWRLDSAFHTLLCLCRSNPVLLCVQAYESQPTETVTLQRKLDTMGAIFSLVESHTLTKAVRCA
jgi:hypothetical protein